MSESLRSPGEVMPSIEPSEIEKAFAADVFEENLRNKQKEAWQEVDTASYASVSGYKDTVFALTKQYLLEAGIAEDDPKFSEYVQTARKYSWDEMPDFEWNIGTRQNDTDELPTPGRMALTIEHETLFGYQISTDGSSRIVRPGAPVPAPVGPTPEELDEAYRMNDAFDEACRKEAERPTDEQINEAYEIHREKEGLAQLREELSAMSAKRQGKLFNIFNKKYNELKRVYNDQLIKVGKLEYADYLASDEKTADEKSTTVVGYLINEQAKLRDLTKEKLQGTRVGRFIEFMNRGGIVKRVAKGVGLGLLVGGTVATGGALLAGVGAAAGLVATTGTATTLATRFARGFASKDAREGRGMVAASEAIDADALKNTLHASGDHFAEGVAHVDNVFETDSKLENKKRRRSAKFGAVAVAAGGIIGTVGAELATGSGVLGHGQSIGNHWRPSWLHHDVHTIADVHHPEDAGGGAGAGGAGASDVPGGKVHEAIPWTTGDSISDAAHTISHGEGWYQTFSEMGITTAHDQARLLNDDVLMGKLANMKLAYIDQRIGGWGIRMTPDGKMPQAAIDLINQHAAQSGLVSAR